MIDAMKLFGFREYFDGGFYEMVAWRVPTPVRGSRHYFKYRFACIVGGTCVLRYDNEVGKGDHKHVEDGAEHVLQFTSLERLRADFLVEARRWIDRDDRVHGDDR